MRVIFLALASLLLVSTALAGPNAGGVLVLHATTLGYTTDIESYEGMSGVACGQDGPPYPGVQECPPYDPWEGADPCDPSAANPTSAMPSGVPHIWYLLAAFPPESCPRLLGLAFRVQYDPAKVAVIADGVSDPQIAVAWPVPSDLDGREFPSNRSGMRLAFGETRTSLLQEIWWFAGYSYRDAKDAAFAVKVLATDDSFVDDSFPRQSDEIAGFGILGLGGTTGSNPSWEDAIGACCHPDATCSITLEAGCLSPGFWQGVGTTCTPNPCSTTPPPGAIVTWGRNEVGQCYVPLPNTGFVAVAGGGMFSLGLKSDGGIEAWGDDDAGQCSVPSPNADFVAVSAGDYHTLGLKSDGTIVAWGQNLHGQCNVPAPNAGFVAIAAGGAHSLGLKSDGTIVAWGHNLDGQCNVPAPNAGFVAVAAGGRHSLGLKADGMIVAWGWNFYHQSNVPEPNANFVAVADGGGHCLGLKADGTVVGWGYNAYGQCNVPSPNAGFVAVSAGGYHTLGLKSDGTMVAWGDNTAGQCDVPALDASFVAVSAGCYHSLGLLSGATMSGACCPPDGTCALTLPAKCPSPSVWQGAGTICTPNPCMPTPVLLESWTASSLTDGLQIRWEVPLGATGAEYRAWRDPVAGSHDVAPTPDAVLVSSAWMGASADGIIETLDREAPRGTTVRYFLETNANGGEFIGSAEARWDPPALAWSAGPTPFRGTVRLTPPGTGPAQAKIFDLSGRLVRTLVRAGGNAPLEWDGRSDAGRGASAGVYLVKVTTPAGETSGRVVLTR